MADVDWRIAASFAESTGGRAVPGQPALGLKAEPCSSVQASGENGELLPCLLLTPACLLGSHLQVPKRWVESLDRPKSKGASTDFCAWTWLAVSCHGSKHPVVNLTIQ